jgi:exosome complex component RRP46
VFPYGKPRIRDVNLCNVGTRERHLESIIHSTLQHVILSQNHPRTLIQVTLQVVRVPDSDVSNSKHSQFSSVGLSPLGLDHN